MDYKGCKKFYAWSRSIQMYDNYFMEKKIRNFLG